MRKISVMVLAVLAATVLAPAVFAQEGGGTNNVNWVALTAGFSMAIASAACGYAQAKAVSAACEGFARNPGAAPAIRFAIILALVLIESMALYTFAIIFLKVS
ncbi:MAG: ATP synthase F0 subunit C [Firmicutes bacterium]|nr:ATP synthase F0 subunit C [Bacillota bacterium]